MIFEPLIPWSCILFTVQDFDEGFDSLPPDLWIMKKYIVTYKALSKRNKVVVRKRTVTAERGKDAENKVKKGNQKFHSLISVKEV